MAEERPPAPEPGSPSPGGPHIAVQAGTVQLGSAPGSTHREAASEADGISSTLGAFRIDRLPYPNNPKAPPRTAVSRDEASELCEQAGGRLCSELEWERACKAGVGLQGTDEGRQEWTASRVAGGLGHPLRTAVVRGTLPEQAGGFRCAARTGVAPDSRRDNLGFRCCKGEAQQLSYPSEEARPLARPLNLSADQLGQVLGSIEGLAADTSSFTPFTSRDADAALKRGKRSRASIRVWQITASVFAWSPTAGEELWVISGRLGDKGLIALVHPLPDGSFRHAASTLIEEAEPSIAMGVSEAHPRNLMWTTCYDCPGAGGNVRYGDDARVSFLYR